MPATSCSMVIPKLGRPHRLTSNSRNSNVSSRLWHVAHSPNALNAAHIHAGCGVVALVFFSGEGRKTKCHCARVAPPRDRSPNTFEKCRLKHSERSSTSGAKILSEAHSARGIHGCVPPGETDEAASRTSKEKPRPMASILIAGSGPNLGLVVNVSDYLRCCICL